MQPGGVLKAEGVQEQKPPRGSRRPKRAGAAEAPSFDPLARDGLFTALLDIAVDGIVVLDNDRQVLAMNPACERLFGYRVDEVLGNKIDMLLPAAEVIDDDRYLSRSWVENGAGEGRRETRGRRKDGTGFPVDLSLGEGRVEGAVFLVGVIRDLTELKGEIQRRAEADHLLAQIVQSSDDAIISKSLDGIITSWNSAAERMFGYSAAEALGRNITMLFPPDRLAEEDEIVARLRRGELVEHHETVRLHKDGREVAISLSVSPIRDSFGTITGASKIARDISERKASEAEMQNLQAELHHAGRLSAMGQMSAALAHELNQPLTAIANYARAAERMLKGENIAPLQVESARDAMGKVAGQAMRAGTIIRYLRAFVEKRETRRSTEDLNETVREAVTLSMAGHSHGARLELDLAEGLPLVAIDRIQIQQVVVNLVRNALEAMAECQLRELKISTGRKGAQICITVKDTGPGLREDILARLFDPFVTSKPTGMGMGLKICQSIVEAHGGTIGAAKGERGTTFVVRLPVAR